MVERVKQAVREHPVVVVALSALAVIAVLGVVVHLSARPDNSERRAATPSASVRVSDSTVRAPESTTTRAAQPAATTSHVAALPQLPTTDDPADYARDVAVALFQVDPATVTRAAFLSSGIANCRPSSTPTPPRKDSPWPNRTTTRSTT